MAARSIVMVRKVGGTIYGLRSARPPLTVMTYAEERRPDDGAGLVIWTRASPVTVVRLLACKRPGRASDRPREPSGEIRCASS